MKPALTTEYIHTINFITKSYQSEHGLAGLDMLIEESSQRLINFSTDSIHHKMVYDSLKNIMPEALDNFSYKRLEQIFTQGNIEVIDLRLIIQWLINKEKLPAGSYIVSF